MLHIRDNIKLIRSLSRKTQEDFINLFPGVTVAMQKSYEGGKAKPDAGYIDRLARLTGVAADGLMNRKLTGSDINLAWPVEKVETEANPHFSADQLFHMYMKAIERQDKIMEAQTVLLKSIENKMAREETQAKIDSNLEMVLATLDTTFGAVWELVQKQARDEAGGNPDIAKKILSRIVTKIKPHAKSAATKDNRFG